MIINQKQNIIIPNHTNNPLNIKNLDNNIIGSFVIKVKEKDNFKIIRDLSGSRKIFMGKNYMGIIRTTFLIDSNRKVLKIWKNVRVKDHAKDVYSEIKKIV